RPARARGFVAYDVSAARVEPHLVAITQPRSSYCEQFRSLRTRILQAGEREQMRSFVITSAGMGEGKTVTALNLGWLLAQTEGLRALVIDSDLRQRFQELINQRVPRFPSAHYHQRTIRTIDQHIGVGEDSQGRCIDDDEIKHAPYF